jgi:GT2 family glycosyltransferase
MENKQKNIRVEIVAPVHNRRDITLQCLRSLARINKDGLDVHIIIVDDGSTDGTSEAIKKQFPDVEIVKGDGNLWFTEGTNVGVRAALERNPDYVLTMNDDQIFDSQFLKFMVETAESNPHAVVGALLLLWDEPHKLFQVSPRWETLSGGWRHWTHQTIWTVPKKPWRVDLIVGNCVLFPAQAIREQGLMDSKRYPNFGDAEYTPRLRKKGWNLLIDPRARVFCQPNNIPAKVVKMSLRQKIDALFLNLGHIHNLRRRFYANLDGAPTKIQGFLGFGIFFVRLALRKNVESGAAKMKEKPLSEIYKDETVVN